MAEADPFALLELPWGASETAIRQAFRRLALRYHPDRNQGDIRAAAHFKLVSAAYQRLKVAGFRPPGPTPYGGTTSRPASSETPPRSQRAASSPEWGEVASARPEFWPDGSRIHYPTQQEIDQLIRDMDRRGGWPWFRRAAELWLYAIAHIYAGMALLLIPSAALFLLALIVLAVREWLGFR